MDLRKFTIIITLLFASAEVQSQDYAFKVLANKGANEFKTGGAWQPLKTGASLKPEDELKLSENAYIGLVHSTGKPLELKQAGNYKVADLAARVSGGTSVLVKYTDFILSSNSAEAKKNRLSATGAVHRAVEKSAINLLLPPNQFSGVYRNHVVVRWEDEKASGPYVVVIRNMFDDVLDEIETPETVVRLDLGDKKFSLENAILVEVSAKSDPKIVSEQHLIKKLTPAHQNSIKSSLAAEVQVNESTPLNSLILAGFYEENNLLIDAIAEYEDAIKLAPDVPTFKEYYDEFLLRHGLRQ